MKKLNLLILVFTLAFLHLSVKAQDNSIRATSNVRSAQYPRILPDGRAVFRIKAPEAQKVQLDLARKYDMVKNGEGVWEITTDSLSEGFHYYSLIIDGVAV
jgi:1,4-alpha-glucan branching enzyme